MTGLDSLSPGDAEKLLGSARISAGPGMQGAFAKPTIWPWIAVPSRVPKTSTVIPDEETRRHRKEAPGGLSKRTAL